MRADGGPGGKPKFITLPGGKVIPLTDAEGGGKTGRRERSPRMEKAANSLGERMKAARAKRGIAEPAAGAQPSGRLKGFRPATDAQRKELKVPPGYTNIHVPSAPGHHVIWKGQDSKGRWKQVQSAEFDHGQAAAKWARLRDFNEAAPGLLSKAEKDASSPGRDQDTALAIRLMAFTGFRPGSDVDTGGDVKAYGATTLQARHVEVSGSTVSFDFIGKEGVRQQHSVEDPLLAREIARRKAQAAGPDAPLFDTTREKVGAYIKEGTGNPAFKAKDLRTWVGTTAAHQLVAGAPVPKTPKEYKQARNKVGAGVSKKLGNGPAMALARYIDPAAFNTWRASAGIDGDE